MPGGSLGRGAIFHACQRARCSTDVWRSTRSVSQVVGGSAGSSTTPTSERRCHSSSAGSVSRPTALYSARLGTYGCPVPMNSRADQCPVRWTCMEGLEMAQSNASCRVYGRSHDEDPGLSGCGCRSSDARVGSRCLPGSCVSISVLFTAVVHDWSPRLRNPSRSTAGGHAHRPTDTDGPPTGGADRRTDRRRGARARAYICTRTIRYPRGTVLLHGPARRRVIACVSSSILDPLNPQCNQVIVSATHSQAG